mgnify:CR=1 FL=1
MIDVIIFIEKNNLLANGKFVMLFESFCSSLCTSEFWFGSQKYRAAFSKMFIA